MPVISTNLRIDSYVYIDGVPYRVYDGMTPESMCDMHLAWMARLTVEKAKAAKAIADAATMKQQGLANAAFVQEAQTNIVMMYPNEMIGLAALVSSFLTAVALLFVKGIVKAVKWIIRRFQTDPHKRNGGEKFNGIPEPL